MNAYAFGCAIKITRYKFLNAYAFGVIYAVKALSFERCWSPKTSRLQRRAVRNGRVSILLSLLTNKKNSDITSTYHVRDLLWWLHAALDEIYDDGSVEKYIPLMRMWLHYIA